MEACVMVRLSSLQIYRTALPWHLPATPSIAEVQRAVRQVNEVLAGLQPDELSRDEAAAIRRVAHESEREGAA